MYTKSFHTKASAIYLAAKEHQQQKLLSQTIIDTHIVTASKIPPQIKFLLLFITVVVMSKELIGLSNFDRSVK